MWNAFLYLIVSNWSHTKYRAYAGTKARYVNEQFIELFDLDLVTLPPNLPDWLIDQQNMLVSIHSLSFIMHCIHFQSLRLKKWLNRKRVDPCI